MKLQTSKGQIPLVAMVSIALVTVLVVSVLPVISSLNTAGALSKLTSQGYIVLAAGEYDALLDLLQSVDTKADAAVINAEAAANTSQAVLNTLLLHNENEVFLYPDAATKNVTLTAGNGVATWSTWAEITDSSATTLSSRFAASPGYLVEMMTHDYSIADKIYMVEISYGASKTVVGRSKIRSDWAYVCTLRSVVIPAGETIYYRMQCETALATLKADFRYYFG